MKLKKLILKNFKAYKESEIDFDNISVIVGKNDAGKSSILQALNLFFNPKDTSKMDIFYRNNNEISSEILIECHFDISADEVKLGGEDREILITETNLLNKDRYFVVGYKYTERSLNKSPFFTENYVKCYNYDISTLPWSNQNNTLEQMKQDDLNKAIKTLNLTQPEDNRINNDKRKILETYLINEGLRKTDIEISIKDKTEIKNRIETVFEKLPRFKLFSNDKANSIGDKENSAVIENEIKNIIAEQMKSQLEEINKKMQEGMKDKLNKLNETYQHFFSFLGNDRFTLQDGIPKIDFKTSGIIDNKGLSIENRGSGFRRLALLSLHLSAHKDEEYKNIIFAIEEPETSQNPHNQKGIVDAIHKLTDKGSQIIITTHSPAMAKEFGEENVKYSVIENCGIESKSLSFTNNETMFDEIIKILGILPLDLIGKKLIVFVEGIDEQILLKKINQDIISNNEILFIAGGGNSIHFHIACRYFNNKLKLMSIVDKGYNSVKVKDELCKIYPSSQEADYFIETEKEDITLYYKLENEVDLYYKSDILKENGDVKYNKGDYNRDRKGTISNILKTEILDNKIKLTKEHFYHWEEIESWFNKFQIWNNKE